MDAGSGASSSGSRCGSKCGSATEMSALIRMPVSIQLPKIIFILDNISLSNYVDDFPVEFDQNGLPQSLSEILCDAYAPPLQMILENNPLHMLGMIGAVYISFGHLFYEVVPQPHAENLLTPKAVRSLLRELFVTGMVVEQHFLAAAQRIPCDTIQSLVDRLPANSLKIGCLSGEDDGGAFVSCLNAAANGSTLVFVVGEFMGREIEYHIDNFVKGVKSDPLYSYPLQISSTLWVLHA
ncbi:hypothetical protein FNV43_RR01255 [Rhamnella rubrinervis]|uniref:Uncharacterized protein n=1 Tax=Rhamnella rubrinervis TaxID=2594499 RepID=A0A8K0HPA1_9ROSA|nr:hypothetical protein FNV43_RR01255 [Rhamnella rubrinervis]